MLFKVSPNMKVYATNPETWVITEYESVPLAAAALGKTTSAVHMSLQHGHLCSGMILSKSATNYIRKKRKRDADKYKLTDTVLNVETNHRTLVSIGEVLGLTDGAIAHAMKGNRLISKRWKIEKL